LIFPTRHPPTPRHHFGGTARIERTLSTSDEALAAAKAAQMAGDYKIKFMALQGNAEAQRARHRTTYESRVAEVTSGLLVAERESDEDPAEVGVELALDQLIETPQRSFDNDGDAILTDVEQAAVLGLLDGLRRVRGETPKHRNQYEPPFTEVADKWMVSWEASRDRRPSNTSAQYRSAIRILGNYWGSRTIREIGDSDTAKFVEKLKQLSPKHGRGRLAGLTLEQTIKATDGEPVGLASSTIKRIFLVLSQVWDWAKPHGYCSGDNPFKIKLPKVRKKPHLPWELPDLKTLYRQRAKRDDIVEVFTAALYSGLRLGELAELTWGDVCEEDGIPYFLLLDTKTEAGNRKVPIHSALDWLLQKKRGCAVDLVWPTFTTEGARNAGTGDASKLFGDWKRRAGFDSRRYTFHSSRKNFVSQLAQKGAQQSDVARLVGHEVGLTYGVYAPHGLGLPRLKDFVELVSYPDEIGVLPLLK
jgi:integrase